MALPHSSALLLETGIRHEDDDCDCGCGSDGRILSGGGSGTRRRCRAWSIVWRRRARTDRGRCRRRGGLHRWSCDLPFVGAATVQDDTPRTVLRQAGNAATLRPQQQSALRKKSGSRAGRSATEAGSAHSTCSHSSCSAGSRLRVTTGQHRTRLLQAKPCGLCTRPASAQSLNANFAQRADPEIAVADIRRRRSAEQATRLQRRAVSRSPSSALPL